MYHLHPMKGLHFSQYHPGLLLQRIIHDERFQAVAVAATLLGIIAFAVWLGSI